MKKEENQETTVKENTPETTSSSSMIESNVDTSFFYTNDKFINSFDNVDIIQCILRKYKNICDQTTDSLLKKSIVQFLDDDEFVEYVLSYYNLSTYELFKIIYKLFGSIFKGPYLKKIRKIVERKDYAKPRRKQSDY